MAVNNGPRVMVIGSINIDLVAGVDRLPREGETVWALGFEQHLGGKGANQAAVAGLMGAQAVMVGCVGDDVFGPRALQGLQQVGVDCSLVRTVAGTSTGAALITVGRRGENTIVVIPGANGAVTPADVERAAGAMAACDAVMVQFEVPEAVVLAVAQTIARLREAAARPLLVLNPSPFRASALPPAGTVDLLIVNELEAEEMTGHKVANPADAAEAARKLLPWLRPGGRVVVTLGEQGAVALSDGDMPAPLYIPARKVQAVDTTGAGDTFAGALVVQLCAGRSMAEALRFATTAAAITMTRPGAQSSFPRREEVEAALAGAPEPVPLLRKG